MYEQDLPTPLGSLRFRAGSRIAAMLVGADVDGVVEVRGMGTWLSVEERNQEEGSRVEILYRTMQCNAMQVRSSSSDQLRTRTRVFGFAFPC